MEPLMAEGGLHERPRRMLTMLLCPRRIAVFSVTVLHDERIVIVAEQRPDSTEEDSFQWMSRVLQVALPRPGHWSPVSCFWPPYFIQIMA